MSFQTTVTLTGGASITNVSLTGCTNSSCTSGTAIVDNTNVPISGFVSGKIHLLQYFIFKFSYYLFYIIPTNTLETTNEKFVLE
jgi:hypothetical protein